VEGMKKFMERKEEKKFWEGKKGMKLMEAKDGKKKEGIVKQESNGRKKRRTEYKLKPSPY